MNINVFIPAALCFFLSTTSAFGQNGFLSYGNKNDSQGGQVELDWDAVKGDLTQRMWCDTKSALFNEIDINNDKYLNKRDLSEINTENIQNWTITTIKNTFNHWSPNSDEHINNIKKSLDLISNESSELNITKDSFKSIEDSFSQLGMLKLKNAHVYIEAIPKMESLEVVSEGFTETGRKWITSKTPVKLIIHNGAEKTSYNITVLLVGVAKFKQHSTDSNIALVEMGLN